MPFALLQAIAETPEDALQHSLATLQAGDFLYEARLFPDLEYTFKHALTHEVAYGSLLQERRGALHAQIVDSIEGLYPDRLAEHVERLAHHAVRGEAWEKAVTYLHQAGARAAERSAFERAAAAYEEALRILPRLPESRSTLERAVDLRIALRDVLTPLDERDRVLDHMLAAMPMAERLGDRWRQTSIASGLVNVLLALVQYRRGAAEGTRALALADGLDDPLLQARVRYRVGATYHLLGDFPRAMGLLCESVALSTDEHDARRGPAALSSVIARVWLALGQAETGSFAEALTTADEAVQIATTADQPFSLVAACWGLGQVCLRRGDLDRAASALTQGLEVGRTWNIVNWFTVSAAALGYVRALGGRDPEALRLPDEAVTASASRARFFQSLRLGWYAEAHLLAGRLAEARRLAQDALRVAEAHEEIASRAWTLRLLGDIAARGDRSEVDEAEAHYRHARALADQLGMRLLVAHCHLGLGKLYRRTGEPEQAQEHLATALTMYREMGMTFWLERAEAELASP